ncbi:MAG: hypothetical protein IKS37_04050 [Solobacterium sp.]|nr:hypothetical protein [Solobacterium sp.]
MKYRNTAMAVTLGMLVCSLSACSAAGSAASSEDSDAEDTDTAVTTDLSKIDSTKWLYNEDDDVWYQTGISYCSNPADASYETLAVFVPGAYIDGTKNDDGTYTCTLNTTAEINGYTAQSAPVVMPINTPGYSAQAALTDYSSSVTSYTDAGFVYVHAGCRGRDAGAPAGVADLKAAIRYIRYSKDTLAGDTDSIFTFGMSGGGAQSAIVGASGNSALYDAYLKQIGAVEGVSDAVLGSVCWCPITNLDSADGAYEWMMGVTRSGLSEDEQALSDQLARYFAEYINNAGLVDEEGNALTLEKSEEGVYQAGSYYEYLKNTIEESLEHFLEDTEFPYTASSSQGGGHMHGGGQRPDGGTPPDGERPEGMPEGEGPGDMNFEAMDDITRNDTSASGLSLTGTYETAQDYIDALNVNGEWVSYDASANTVTIKDIASFVQAFKTASKNLGAFDQLDRGQGENTLFGYGDGSGAHFDAMMRDVLASINSVYANEYAQEYDADILKTDSLGNTAETRVNMYTPLYYLLSSQEGYQTSTPAKYWRIRTGINQSDCALSTEANLTLALESNTAVESVDFETVWGQGHTQAERTGNSTENFIAWVQSCTMQK